VLVDREITWLLIKAALKSYDARFVSDYYGADIGNNQKTVTIRITCSAPDRTLTDREADAIAASVLNTLSREFDATVRG